MNLKNLKSISQPNSHLNSIVCWLIGADLILRCINSGIGGYGIGLANIPIGDVWPHGPFLKLVQRREANPKPSILGITNIAILGNAIFTNRVR